MNQPISISSSVVISSSKILLNGKLIYESNGLTTPEFLQAAYDSLQINYPKFFKMDNLCKTGFLATELLLRENDSLSALKQEEVGIILSSANSSLDTDIRYEASIANTPSPSLFVYTLPNVLIGELCIRHHVKGETACFVFDIFDAAFQSDYVNLLFETDKVKACISGWADYFNGKAEAFFYLAERTEALNSLPHNTETLNQIRNN